MRAILLIFALLIGMAPEVLADSKFITGSKLAEILDGRKAVDVTRDNHWFVLKPDGTALVASKGIEFPTTYEDQEKGWCRTLTLPAGTQINKQRFEKYRHLCQDIGFDGSQIQFYFEDGTPSNVFKIQD